MSRSTYTYTVDSASRTDPCVNLSYGNTIIGRINTLSVYNDGWDDCFATRSFSGTASKTLDYGESVSVSASITNSSGTSVTIGSRTFTAPSDNGGVSSLGLSSAYDSQPSADEDKGELTANKYYKVTAVPVSGTGKSFSFKTPAGGSDSSLAAYITNCQGSNASSYVQYSGASSVNSNVVKDADGVKGYVWMKGPNGWERTRYIPISHPQTTAGISYVSHDRGTYSGYLRVTVHLTSGDTETYTSQPM